LLNLFQKQLERFGDAEQLHLRSEEDYRECGNKQELQYLRYRFQTALLSFRDV